MRPAEWTGIVGDVAVRRMPELSLPELLTAAEEVRLARRVERGDRAARDRMIVSNVRLVIWVAKRFQGRGLALEDLIQEGTLGLIRAVEKYDWRRGCRFSTYAIWWIRQACLRALRNAAAPLLVRSLDEQIGDDGLELGDLLGDDRAGDGFEAVERRLDARIFLAEAARVLPSRERYVVARRYGPAPATLRQVGAELGVTRERARQLEQNALLHLRRHVCQAPLAQQAAQVGGSTMTTRELQRLVAMASRKGPRGRAFSRS